MAGPVLSPLLVFKPHRAERIRRLSNLNAMRDGWVPSAAASEGKRREGQKMEKRNEGKRKRKEKKVKERGGEKEGTTESVGGHAKLACCRLSGGAGL